MFVCKEDGVCEGVVGFVRVGGCRCGREDGFYFSGESGPVSFVVVGVRVSILGSMETSFSFDGYEDR